MLAGLLVRKVSEMLQLKGKDFVLLDLGQLVNDISP
jgi:hypothetical protein